jgi:hypothetical protein
VIVLRGDDQSVVSLRKVTGVEYEVVRRHCLWLNTRNEECGRATVNNDGRIQHLSHTAIIHHSLETQKFPGISYLPLLIYYIL